jgi:hypothetical protein
LRAPDFRWGREEEARRDRGPLILAAALHSILLFGWVTGRPPDEVRRPRELIALAPLELEGREVAVPIPARIPEPERSRGVRSPRAAIFTTPPPAPPRPLAERSEDASAPVAMGLPRGRVGRLAPGLGEGRLWVEPLPLPPRQLAAALTRKSPQEMADSYVTAVVQAYLDSIAVDPELMMTRPPSWVANVGGTKFGIDASNIYVAGLKIPTAILALLPINASGNQATLLDHDLEAMATDLRIAGARSNNIDDFRKAVRELRKQKEAEREFERNRRTEPGDTLRARTE